MWKWYNNKEVCEDMKFRVVDGDYLPYDEIKKDYENGITGNALKKKYNITHRGYKSILDRLEADGVKLVRGRQKKRRKVTNIHYNRTQNNYKVEKIINGKKIYGGSFKKRADAELRRNELEANGWVV